MGSGKVGETATSKPDWVLIYRKDDLTLQLGRIGSHSDLFE
ncbi:MAG: type II toxin-antitoxin system YafQ family toxin [Isosphaeraceae bacterium]